MHIHTLWSPSDYSTLITFHINSNLHYNIHRPCRKLFKCKHAPTHTLTHALTHARTHARTHTHTHSVQCFRQLFIYWLTKWLVFIFFRWIGWLLGLWSVNWLVIGRDRGGVAWTVGNLLAVFSRPVVPVSRISATAPTSNIHYNSIITSCVFLICFLER